MSVNVIQKGKLVKVAGYGEGAQIYFLERTSFPVKGDPAALYVATDENVIYRYDMALLMYLSLSNTESVGDIDWKIIQ